MHPMAVLGILLSLTAILGWVNRRWLKLPSSVALMAMSLVLSVGFLIVGGTAASVSRRWMETLNFSEVLLHGMLAFLLFAGALHVEINDLLESKWTILILATVGVLGSTILVGLGTWGLSASLGLALPAVHCLLFGALISPTDPIAVLSILRQAEAPRSLETKISGESLFNDGIGVVVFLTLLKFAQSGETISMLQVLGLFALEVFGGIAIGLGLGYVAYRMLRSVDDYPVEALITLALVTGGFALADAVHASGPLAMVVAGLLIGNQGRRLAMSKVTREHLDRFWELIDEILNAVLFLLIGLESLLLTLEGRYFLAGAAAVPMVLLTRLVCVGGPVEILRSMGRPFAPRAIRVMTWGGLRGGISVALALSLPEGPMRGAVLTMTYVVVAFSVLVQGLTVRHLIRRSLDAPALPRKGN